MSGALSRRFHCPAEDAGHFADGEQGHNDLATSPRAENGVGTVIVGVGSVLKVLQRAALNRHDSVISQQDGKLLGGTPSDPIVGVTANEFSGTDLAGWADDQIGMNLRLVDELASELRRNVCIEILCHKL
jgi:hypothetical protein